MLTESEYTIIFKQVFNLFHVFAFAELVLIYFIINLIFVKAGLLKNLLKPLVIVIFVHNRCVKLRLFMILLFSFMQICAIVIDSYV